MPASYQSATQNQQSAKPYDQLPGEPDLWYSRSHSFCLLGPSRNLDSCYRQVMGERHAITISDPARGFQPASAASHQPGNRKP